MLKPGVKIIINIIYIILLFCVKTWVGYFIMLAIVFLTCFIVKLPIRNIIKFFIKISPLLLLTAVANMLYIKGNIVASFGIIEISKEGLELAAKMIVRIVCLIMSAKILNYTTPPLALANRIGRNIKAT